MASPPSRIYLSSLNRRDKRWRSRRRRSFILGSVTRGGALVAAFGVAAAAVADRVLA